MKLGVILRNMGPLVCSLRYRTLDEYQSQLDLLASLR